MPDPNHQFQRNEIVETAPLQNDAILFHSGHNRFCMLNKTSSFIWTRLQAPVTAGELVQEILATFDGVDPDEAMKDVNAALDQLIELDLVVKRPCDQ